MIKHISLCLFGIAVLVSYSDAQAGQDLTARYLSLATRVALERSSSGEFWSYKRSILRISSDKGGRIFMTTSKIAKAGQIDTIRLHSHSATIKYTVFVTNPNPIFKFKNFYDHMSGAQFLNSEPLMTLRIQGLNDDDLVANDIKIVEAVFCHFSSDSSATKYTVNSATVGNMFSAIRKKYRVGDNLVLSELAYTINGRKFRSQGNLFNFISK